MEQQPPSNGKTEKTDSTKKNSVTPSSSDPITSALQTSESKPEKNEAQTDNTPLPKPRWERIRTWLANRPKREPARFTDHLIGWSTLFTFIATVVIAYWAGVQERYRGYRVYLIMSMLRV